MGIVYWNFLPLLHYSSVVEATVLDESLLLAPQYDRGAVAMYALCRHIVLDHALAGVEGGRVRGKTEGHLNTGGIEGSTVGATRSSG